MAAPSAAQELCSKPILERPKKTWPQTLNAFLFVVVFNLGCIMINGFQFTILVPLWLLPFSSTRKLYDEGIRYSRGAFGLLLGPCKVHTCPYDEVHWFILVVTAVLISQWFGPTKLVISFEKEGQGRFTDKEIEELVVKDASGRVTELRLPQKAVMIANHQVNVTYFSIT